MEEYRRIVCAVIREHASIAPSRGNVRIETIFDDAIGHYELMYSGWNGPYRIHGSVLHIDIRDGKVWIEYDGTEEGVAEKLVDAGIPKDQIVLAFKPPEVRRFTGYAAV